MTSYDVYLKTARGIIPVEADKFVCDQNGDTIFYVRSSKDQPFEEVALFKTSNIKRIKES
jgi:hypothetical protein